MAFTSHLKLFLIIQSSLGNTRSQFHIFTSSYLRPLIWSKITPFSEAWLKATTILQRKGVLETRKVLIAGIKTRIYQASCLSEASCCFKAASAALLSISVGKLTTIRYKTPWMIIQPSISRTAILCRRREERPNKQRTSFKVRLRKPPIPSVRFPLGPRLALRRSRRISLAVAYPRRSCLTWCLMSLRSRFAAFRLALRAFGSYAPPVTSETSEPLLAAWLGSLYREANCGLGATFNEDLGFWAAYRSWISKWASELSRKRGSGLHRWPEHDGRSIRRWNLSPASRRSASVPPASHQVGGKSEVLLLAFPIRPGFSHSRPEAVSTLQAHESERAACIWGQSERYPRARISNYSLAWTSWLDRRVLAAWRGCRWFD